MNLPAEFVVYRRISEYSNSKKLASLGCPNDILNDVSRVCGMWARCFRGYSWSELSSQGVPVDRFLEAADFSVFQIHNQWRGLVVATDCELWYWIMRVAEVATSSEFFHSMIERLNSPEFHILVPTWTGHSPQNSRMNQGV